MKFLIFLSLNPEPRPSPDGFFYGDAIGKNTLSPCQLMNGGVVVFDGTCKTAACHGKQILGTKQLFIAGLTNIESGEFTIMSNVLLPSIPSIIRSRMTISIVSPSLYNVSTACFPPTATMTHYPDFSRNACPTSRIISSSSTKSSKMKSSLLADPCHHIKFIVYFLYRTCNLT